MQLDAFIEKMTTEGLPDIVIETFAHYYNQIAAGETGLIPDREITPLAETDVADFKQLSEYTQAGRKVLDRTVMIVLNGGLGTSMGLTGPKSLLPVKDGRSFLDLTISQAQARNVRLVLMNSFTTHAPTLKAVSRLNPSVSPQYFLQHKFPKILQEDLSPARWPAAPELEWNPPGHGDIFIAMHTSGMLDTLVNDHYRYAFISNSDNLGATMAPALLGYFAKKEIPFMMEVARRTPADLKGGHLARHRNGRLILREIAQCPEEETDAFQDIDRYRFFNTNSLWIDLDVLRDRIAKDRILPLPIILNPKTLDPRDNESPDVFQVETAMGAAISLFENAAVVQVPPTRFFPVKKCSDLLAVRSDCFHLTPEGDLSPSPDRKTERLRIVLDPAFYGKIDAFDSRFPDGVPSLKKCTSLEISGDVRFEDGVVMKGDVRIVHEGNRQAVIPSGTVCEGSIRI